MDGQTNGQTNGRNYTNFERNLAMMVIYLPVKFEFDWTNHFQVSTKNVDGQMDIGHINLMGGLVTCNLPKNLIYLLNLQYILSNGQLLNNYRLVGG